MALISENTSKNALSKQFSAVSNRSLDKSSSSISAKSGADADEEDKTENENDDDDDEEDESTRAKRPFQRLDFLVRDWQDFSRKDTLLKKRADMKEYMKDLLSSRKQKDLADTREQINSCFEHLHCFLLPHPGHEVTEREYDGAVSAIDNRFLELLTNYLDDLFDPKHLVPKKIHTIPVTSRELLTYIKAYGSLFREATIFPEAKTLLEATAEANNVNMRDKALSVYKKEMDKVAGPKCSYVVPKEITAHHNLCMEGAITVFDNGANMGRRSQILNFRQALVDEIEKEHARYVEVNAERDPYKYLEFYLVPGVIAISLLVFRITQDLFCYENIGYDVPLYDCKYVTKRTVFPPHERAMD
jgi:atlastin